MWDESGPLQDALRALIFENVPFDRLSRDRARCTNILTLRPKMLLSTRLFETGKLLSYIPRRLSLEQIGNQGRTEARRRAHKDMDVIFIRFYREQRQPLSFATFSDQSLGFRLDFPHQHPASVLGNHTR